ncbi:MAG: serine O-acetyltransferase [Acidimicrobiales bacterium]|nr:serine O-acetyltransferase [Hyphomonadaceae bacterium]RZV40977.1 MAG: serine O-acetyltransferase [Acidimicrobiales bacterium]
MAQIKIARSGSPDVEVWETLQKEAASLAQKEKALSSLLHTKILVQETFCRALAGHLAESLSTADLPALHLSKTIMSVYEENPDAVEAAARDLIAVYDRDPACKTFIQAFLYFKGFLALQTHRIAHALYKDGRELLAFHLQSRSSELYGVDINPAARIGSGIMFDHATGIVIGETAVVGDDCSILHGVTLGGTGKESEDRHPKIGERVMIGAGAKILGNIKIGDMARIAAGSVVLKDVPSKCTVAGVPAKAVGGPCCDNPAGAMSQTFDDNSK